MQVEVPILSSLSLISLVVSADVKQHLKNEAKDFGCQSLEKRGKEEAQEHLPWSTRQGLHQTNTGTVWKAWLGKLLRLRDWVQPMWRTGFPKYTDITLQSNVCRHKMLPGRGQHNGQQRLGPFHARVHMEVLCMTECSRRFNRSLCHSWFQVASFVWNFTNPQQFWGFGVHGYATVTDWMHTARLVWSKTPNVPQQVSNSACHSDKKYSARVTKL